MPIATSTTFVGKEEGDSLEIAYLYVVETASETFYLTSHDTDVTFLNFNGSDTVFRSAIITHGRFERKYLMEDSEVDVDIGVTEKVLPQIVYRVSFDNPTIRIFRCHIFYDADEIVETNSANSLEEVFALVFNYSESEEYLTLSARVSVFQDNSQIPRKFFQKTCNHSFASPFCGVDINLHKVSGSIVGVNSSKQLLYVNAGTTANKFQGGYVEHIASGFKIGIRSQTISGGNLVLSLYNWSSVFMSFNTPPNEQVIVFPDCKKTVAFCRDVYNNLENFGGFAFMPLRNPQSSGVSKDITTN